MKYKFEDDTNDRKYFTIVPNYILNHSSAVDRALYIDIKRAAGEDGFCYMTEETMCKKLGVGEKRLHKSLEYLLNHGWVKFVGMTSAKTRPIKTYRVVDIWNKNIEFYNKKKIVVKSGVSKDTPQKKGDTLQKQDKIPSRSSVEEEHIKEEPIKKKQHKKYSSLLDVKKDDLQEIADKYKVSFGFVALQFEKLQNYCAAKGRRYKNYKRALMNFVLGDVQRNMERSQSEPKRGIDARDI